MNQNMYGSYNNIEQHISVYIHKITYLIKTGLGAVLGRLQFHLLQSQQLAKDAQQLQVAGRRHIVVTGKLGQKLAGFGVDRLMHHHAHVDLFQGVTNQNG